MNQISFTPAGAAPTLAPEELRRYGRQLVLEEIGPAGQAALKAARVLVVGSGGLGSPVLLYLAAAGVGHLGIVDFDTVDLSNLHRQVLFGQPDIGEAKAPIAADRLRRHNPHLDVGVHQTRITAENAGELIAGHDVVVDATDNFTARYIINDVCVRAGIPNVSASILRFEAQLSVFDPAADGPCYRCLFPAPPLAELAPSCAEAGVVGVLPGIIGCLQANEVIKLICGIGTPLVGRLLSFDALDSRFQVLDLHRDPDCVACGKAADPARTPGLDDRKAACGCAEEPVVTITVEELAQRLAQQAAPFLLDVRGPAERAIAAIPGSVGIPLDRLDEHLDALPRSGPIVCICHKGSRSLKAARKLRQAGFLEVLNLEGGTDAWAARIAPQMARY